MSSVSSGINISTANNGDASSDNSAPVQYEILTLTFNQDCTALAMGTVKNYTLYTIHQENKLEETHQCAFEEVKIIERLFSSSLIAIVTQPESKKLKVFHFKKGTEICVYTFEKPIQAVKLNRSRMIVCLEDSIYIHDLRDMKIIHKIQDISTNIDGLCSLSPSESNSYLAYPGSLITGEIQLFDTINLKSGRLISAHENPLVAMSFDMSGTKIATASNRGTVIRVHNVIDGTCISEFRRGTTRIATIYSLVFSPDSMFLAASSNTETIHIFRLANPNEQPAQEANTWMNTLGNTLSYFGSYLPKQASEMLTQERSFATVHLQSAGIKRAIAMAKINQRLKLFVAAYDGFVSVYEVNTVEGGECKQVSQDYLFHLSDNEQKRRTSESQPPTHDSFSKNSYPPNTLRNPNIDMSHSPVLTNTKYQANQSFDTAIEEHSQPPLSSTPQSDNE